MAGHPQSSPRGLWAKQQINLGPSGLVMGANTTGYVVTTRTALPSTQTLAKIAVIENSTGVTRLAVNTTGTTWRYCATTALITG